MIYRSINTGKRNSRGTALLGALNWLETLYEIDTSKSVGRERTKSLAMSEVPYI